MSDEGRAIMDTPRSNKCPICKKGGLYVTWDRNSDCWVVGCDNNDCSYYLQRPDLRKKLMAINFTDRRKSEVDRWQ